MTETELYAVLRADLTVPPAVARGMDAALETIRAERHPRRGRGRWVRTLLLAAALCTLLAAVCGAAYLALHGGFYEAMFGNPGLSREAEVKYSEDGAWVYTLPKTERVPVDEEQAEALVGAHIVDLGQSVTAEGYTFTFLSHLYDPVSGVGRIYYTLENPDGLDDVTVWEGDCEVSFPGQRGEAGIGTSFFGSRGTLMAQRTYQDPEGSTAERMALCTNYTCEGFREGESVRVELWTRRPDVDSHLAAEVTPVLETFVLPVEAGMTGRTAGSGAVSFSAIGVAVDWDALGWRPEAEVRSVVLECADGGLYTVIDWDGAVNNSAYASDYSVESGCAANRSVYAFNRLVDPDRVTAVVVNGERLEIDG